jgi:hypothetical protein
MRRVAYLIPLAALAAVTLLLREAAPDAWVSPLWMRITTLVLLLAGLGWLVRGARPSRWALASCALLALAMALRCVPQRVDREAWRVHEEARLRQRFEAAHTSLLEVERAARELGREAQALLPDSTAVAATPWTPEARAALFQSLANLLQHPQRSTRAGTEGAGLQVFDAHGELVAWAGTPRAVESGSRLTRLAGGQQPVYFRRSGVYTLLSFEARAGESGSAPGATSMDTGAAGDHTDAPGHVRALVDIPVEVHYQVNNRFLRSHGLAEELSGDGVEVDLTYDAASIPAYLTRTDLEIQGDPEGGIQAFGLLRDSNGAALALTRLNGLPYREALENAHKRLDLAVRWLFLLAVACGWVALHGFVRRRVQTSDAANPIARALVSYPILPILGLWSVRLLLAFLGLPGNRVGGALLNPANFAMVGVGGMLRSPLDLLLTALTVATTAALLFAHAARDARRPQRTASSLPWNLIGGVLAALLVAAAVRGAFGFVGRVVADSNPHLIGSQLDLLAPAVACLHLGLLAGIGGWLVLAMLAADRVRGGRTQPAIAVASMVLVTVLLAWQTTWIAAVAGAGILLCSLRLRTLLRDDRFTSLGLATFVLVALTATLDSDAIHREYFRGNQTRAAEAATALLGPGTTCDTSCSTKFWRKRSRIPSCARV